MKPKKMKGFQPPKLAISCGRCGKEASMPVMIPGIGGRARKFNPADYYPLCGGCRRITVSLTGKTASPGRPKSR